MEGATAIVEHDPWWPYGLVPGTLGGRELAVTVSYEGEQLRALYLTDMDSRFGTSWDD